MMLWPLLALALAVDDGPISTNIVARPTDPPPPPPAASFTPAGAPERAAGMALVPADIPASAPKDDYGFVAWCHGALQGHMDLYEAVKEELNKVSPEDGEADKEQLAAGRAYLALYTRALKAAEKYSPRNIHDQGVDADIRGRRIWVAAKTAEPRTRMWSWLMWELPPRCEIAAKRLEKDAPLLGQVLKGAAPPPSEPAAAPVDSAALDTGDPVLARTGLLDPR